MSARTALARRRRTRFFVAISGAILAIVIVGFARTLYLRALFHPPPIPTYLYLHGAVLTAWFGLVVAQTVLIRGGRVATHRRLGVVGVCAAAAVIIVSTMVTLRFVDRVMHAPTELDVRMSVIEGLGTARPMLGLASTALWGNLTSLVIFALLVGCAVLTRRRGDVHKRLMVLASLSILAPAIARISRWPGLGGDLGPLVPIVMLLLLGAIVGFDMYSRRRVHWATLAGGALVVFGVVTGGVLARTDFGLSMVRHLV